MAAPMTPAEPTRTKEIKAREDAIRRKLFAQNHKNQAVARSKINPKTGGTKTYETQRISGSREGFEKSDYGVGAGAAIPYQILKGTGKISVNKSKYQKPKPKPKPKPKVKPKYPGHTVYKVRRGDTLSGIGKRHGKDWRDIWNYNLKNRDSDTVKSLRQSGPNRIYRGGTFYIPR